MDSWLEKRIVVTGFNLEAQLYLPLTPGCEALEDWTFQTRAARRHQHKFRKNPSKKNLKAGGMSRDETSTTTSRSKALQRIEENSSISTDRAPASLWSR